ncbi:hypothetical protein NPX79_02600 [Spiroplasma endosymbiont of Anurida maritima]|uniref:hypothetical protein n=1 Tax=Spiroplasma endosymbiont of Anurida maritima TaxID=2967972 RepID=UPI0036D330D8
MINFNSSKATGYKNKVFKKYAIKIAKENKIFIVSRSKWYYNLWIIGWNNLKVFSELLKDILRTKQIDSDNLINSYYSSQNLAADILKICLNIESCFKGFLEYKGHNAEYQKYTIGDLINKTTFDLKKEYIEEQKTIFGLFVKKITQKEVDAQEAFQNWLHLRNNIAHNNFTNVLKDKKLTTYFYNILCLLPLKSRLKHKKRFLKHLKKIEFLQDKLNNN